MNSLKSNAKNSAKNALRRMGFGPIILLVALANITGPTGRTQNVGGCTGRIRWAPKSTFTTIAKKIELDDPALVNNIDLVVISDDHEFGGTDGWYEMYITRDTGDVKFTMNPERDTTGSDIVYEAITPGADAETEAQLILIANDRNIFQIELADGKWIQAGSDKFPAELKYGWASEKNGKGERGWKVTISGFETTKQYYAGAFTMAGA